MKKAARYGLTHRCGLILRSDHVDIHCRVARDDREFTDDELAQLADVVARLHIEAKPPSDLTKAQIGEALQCIANGDRHAAAASKLGMI